MLNIKALLCKHLIKFLHFWIFILNNILIFIFLQFRIIFLKSYLMDLFKRMLHIFYKLIYQQFQKVVLDRNLSFIDTIGHVFKESHGALLIVKLNNLFLDLYKKFFVLFLVLIINFVLSLTFSLYEVFYFVSKRFRLNYFWNRF
jgi:hypothetical protein